MSTHLSNDEDTKVFDRRFRVLYLVMGIAMLLFWGRLWHLQISNGAELRLFSERNRIKESKILAPRGLIFDHQGNVLAENIPGFEAIITPQYTTDLQRTSHAIARALDMSPEDIIQKVQKSRRQSGPFFPVRIKDDLSRDQVFRLKLLRYEHAGLDIREVIVRNYPLKEQAAHVLGYVGEISKDQITQMNENASGLNVYQQGDIIGRSGIEKSMQDVIRGVDGVAFKQVDAMGREAAPHSMRIFGKVIENERALPGNILELTLDSDLQRVAYKAFEEKGRTGALVALRPTGEILAWVSYPAYDPNVFSTGITPELWKSLINDELKPLTNKVIQDHNSPGSTFKPFVALPALEEKIIDPTEKVHSPGAIRFGRRFYNDHQRGGHGHIDLYQALERSSNIYFYKLGIELGIQKMHDYISRLGIGTKTGIEIDGEVSGLMPSPEWKQKAIGETWQPGENLSTAIGQGFVLTTPLQMAVAYAAIATEGQLYKPYLVKRISTPQGIILNEKKPHLVADLTVPDKKGISISKETFRHVKKGLWMVGNGERGTARWYKVPGVEISGKTGTSQVMSMTADQLFAKCDERPREQRFHGWFMAFAPKENPEIIVAVLAEHSCSGSGGGAPLAKEVLKTYFEKFHPGLAERAREKTTTRVPTAQTLPTVNEVTE